MPVSALVLTVDSQFDPVESILATDPRLLLGPAAGRFVPAVSTTASLREARDLANQIASVAGVLDVQLLNYADEELNAEGTDSSGPARPASFDGGAA